MEDFKNCMLEFLKQQEILSKQEMEKFENQRLEDLERNRKEREQQDKKLSKLRETFSKRENNPGSSNIFSLDSVIKSIGEFVYKPDEEVTFGAYFRRYEGIFPKGCVTCSDWKKVRLLLGWFGAVEREKYETFILPRHPGNLIPGNNTNINKNIQGAVFTFQCTMAMKENEDYTTFASIVKRECEKFRLSE